MTDELPRASPTPFFRRNLLRLQPPGAQPNPFDDATYARAFWARVFDDHYRTDEELTPYRLRIAWRWLRELGRARGLLTPDTPLADVAGWDLPLKGAAGPAPTRTTALLLKALDAAPAGLPLDPSAVPPQDRDAYHEAFMTAAGYLGFAEGTATEPSLGSYGMHRLHEPEDFFRHFPPIEHVLVYEDFIVNEALAALIEKTSTTGATKKLQETYGLDDHEALSLIRLARYKAKEHADQDLDQARAVMVLRLEALAEAAKDACDVRGQERILKQLGIIQGLAKAEVQDEARDFIDAVKRVNADHPAPPPRLEVDADELDDDE